MKWGYGALKVAPLSAPISHETKSLPSFLRLLFCSRYSVLLLVTGALGFVTFYTFQMLEIRTFEQQFVSSVSLLQGNIEKSFLHALGAAMEMSIIVSSGANLSSNWPNATLPDFQRINAYRLPQGNYRAIAVYHFVNTSELAGFEAYVNYMVNNRLIDGYAQLQNRSYPISRGVFVKAPNGTLIHDDGTHNGQLFPNTIVAVWQISPLTLVNAVLDNAMSELPKRQAIEYVLQHRNATLSDVVQLFVDPQYRPSSQFYAPVYDLHDSSKIVAVCVYSFSWDTFLEGVLADYIVGVTVVMVTATQVSSYFIKGPQCTYTSGDVHDSRFDYLRQDIVLPSVGNPNITYQLAAYPSQELYQSYMTSTPYIAMSIVVALCLAVISITFTYIYVTVQQEKRTHEEQVRSQAEAEFTSFLAHEVRNPLSGIDSSSQLMLSANRRRLQFLQQRLVETRPVDVEEVQTLLEDAKQLIDDGEHIHKCVQYIQSILNNTLDLAKLKDGKMRFKTERVLVRAEVIDVAVTMLSSMKAEEVNVVIDCASHVFVNADPLRLLQVVVNLLTNSFKFCKRGHVKIGVTTIHDSDTIQISVEDTGPGIPIEHRDKLFSKYGQIAVRQGTGLGLCLAYVLLIFHCMCLKNIIFKFVD